MQHIEKNKREMEKAFAALKDLIGLSVGHSITSYDDMINYVDQDPRYAKNKDFVLDYISRFMEVIGKIDQYKELMQNKNVSTDIPDGKRGYYIKYPESFKKMVVEKITSKQKQMNEVANDYGIPIKNVFRWVNKGINKKKGGGRKSLDNIMEEELYKKILKRVEAGKPMDVNQIREEARKLSHVVSFLGSKGWFDKFKKRYKLTKLQYLEAEKERSHRSIELSENSKIKVPENSRYIWSRRTAPTKKKKEKILAATLTASTRPGSSCKDTIIRQDLSKARGLLRKSKKQSRTQTDKEEAREAQRG